MRYQARSGFSGFASIMAAFLIAAGTSGTRVSPVPTEVFEIHEELLAALDRGDAEAVGALLSEEPVLYVVDQSARPVVLSGATLSREQCAASLVSLWAPRAGEAKPTRLLSISIVAEDPTFKVVTFEFERPMNDVDRFRTTSILVQEDTESGPRNLIRHLHVSPASREDYRE